ncbi:hypothetical protein [Rhodohalobacter sp. SW132]|uniref:hypothetical protein n=1 Tax=Rhodohalobacter sp. SW132 TaxID=2293433 RepID=UPI0011C06D07|nr:hypothetical protein [Rhodohalobacter sp. SW132]
MKIFIWIALLLAAGLPAAIAQTHQNPGEVFIEQAAFNHNDAVVQFTGEFSHLFEPEEEFSASFSDGDHHASVLQSGKGNLTLLNQIGFNNRTILNLIGADNVAGVVQNGDNNQAAVRWVGSANEFEYLQLGDFNRMEVQQSGSGVRQRFEQIGSNHALQVIGRGIPLNISQFGNGASAVVETY